MNRNESEWIYRSKINIYVLSHRMFPLCFVQFLVRFSRYYYFFLRFICCICCCWEQSEWYFFYIIHLELPIRRQKYDWKKKVAKLLSVTLPRCSSFIFFPFICLLYEFYFYLFVFFFHKRTFIFFIYSRKKL